MANITTRAGKGSPLTNAEVDANFTALNADLLTKQSTLVSGTSIKTVNGQSVLGSGNIQIDGGVTSFNARTGAVTLSSGDVTTALGFTPYNSTNPSGYITGSALSSYLPLSGGTVTGDLLVQGGSSRFPSHFFHYEYDSAGNIYEHYYAPGSENAKNSRANLRVAATSGYYKTLSFSGDGSFTWEGYPVLTSNNYTSYSPSLTGSGASGTWGISISGNSSGSNWTNYQYSTGNSNDWVQSFQATPAHATSFREMSANGPAGTWWMMQNFRHSNSSDFWGTQVAWGWEDNANNLYTRNISGNSFGGWVRYLNSSNYSSYALPLSGGTLSGAITSSLAPAAINATTPGLANYGVVFNGASSPDNAQAITWTWANGGSAQAGIYVQSSGNYGTKMYLATTDSFATGAKTAVSIDHTGAVNIVRGALTQAGNQVLHAGNYTSYRPPILGAINTTATGVSSWNPGGHTYQAWGQYFTHSNISGDSGDLTLWLRPSQYVGGGTELSMYIDGDYYAGSGLNKVLHAGNYGGYSTFTGAVTSAGNTGFRNDVYYSSVRNPIWSFGNATSYGISYFQGTAGIGDSDVIGIHPNGTATATGASFAVGIANSYVNNNVVLHAGNYNSYSPTLTGSGASGTWGINITGSAGYASAAGYAPLLSAVGSYTFSASTNGRSFEQGIQAGFVSNGEGYPSYGSVVRVKTYSNDGGTAELYFPYSATYGGSSMRYRMGQYDNAGWTGWKTVLDSDNYTSYAWERSGGWKPSSLSGATRQVGISSPDGGEFALAYAGGQTYAYVDGWFYQNEGQYRVLDTQNYSSYALPLSGGTLSGNVNFTNLYPNGNTAYGIEGNNGYFDTVNSGDSGDALELVYVRGSSVKVGAGTYGSKPLYAVGLYDNGSRVLSQEGASYYQVNTWLQMNGTHGLYWPNNNGAHFQANDNSYYAPVMIQGSRGGYTGIMMYSMPQGGGNGHWMSNGNATGYYNDSYGWKWHHESGVFTIFSGTHGGGSGYTALHSGNYGSYALPLSGGTVSGSTTFNNAVNVNGRDIRYFELDSFKEFYVGGDANTYYPVLFGVSAFFHFGRWSLSRHYGDAAPWDPIGTGSHKGGLTLTWEWSGDGAWGGNDKTIRVNQFAESYTTMVGGLALSVNGLIVWLRGGNAYYKFHGPGGTMNSVTPNYSTYTASDGSTYAPRSYDGGTVTAEVVNRMPVRGTHELYDTGNRVLHLGNYGSYALPLSGGTLTGDLVMTAAGLPQIDLLSTGTVNRINWRIRSGIEGVANGGFSIKDLSAGVTRFSIDSAGTVDVPGALQQAGNQVLHASNYTSYAPSLTGSGASGTWGITTTADWLHSDRDFPNGTLITTNINYANWSGDAFVLEIRGNSYGNIVPLDLQYQGYIYSDTIISHGGLSNGLSISGMVALNVGGNLCFWFPTQGYWNGYKVRVYVPYGGRPSNRVTSITSQSKPSGTKEVELSSGIRQSLHSGNYTSYSPSLTGSGATGNWGIQSATVKSWDGYGRNGTGMAAFYNWGGSDGGANAPSGSTYTLGIDVGSNPSDQGYGFQIASNMFNTGLWTRSYYSGAFASWTRLLDASNYSSYALPLSGGTLTGNLGIGLAPNAGWSSLWNATQLGVSSIAGFNSTGFQGIRMAVNAAGSGTTGSQVLNAKYIESKRAGAFFIVPNAGTTNCNFYWASAPSGTAGNAITWTYPMVLDTNGYLLIGYTGSNGAYGLQVNGQIFATSSTIATSDARYKENVETLTGALDVIKALRPVMFNWKEHAIHKFDTSVRTVGFLAQEFQQVLADKPYLNGIVKASTCVIEPEVRDEDGELTKAAVTEDFLGIAEGNVIPLLTRALQEQQVFIEAQEQRILRLESLISTLIGD